MTEVTEARSTPGGHLAATLRSHRRPSAHVQPSGRTMRFSIALLDSRAQLERFANEMNSIERPDSIIRNYWVATEVAPTPGSEGA